MGEESAVGAGRWQESLGYAVTGRHLVIEEPGKPDLRALLTELARQTPGGLDALRSEVASVRAAGRWPHAVPEELMSGIGPAQFAAALAALAAELDPQRGRTARLAMPGGAVTPEDRRLLDEVPPHHGG